MIVGYCTTSWAVPNWAGCAGGYFRFMTSYMVVAWLAWIINRIRHSQRRIQIVDLPRIAVSAREPVQTD
jgi:hypothetical protein